MVRAQKIALNLSWHDSRATDLHVGLLGPFLSIFIFSRRQTHPPSPRLPFTCQIVSVSQSKTRFDFSLGDLSKLPKIEGPQLVSKLAGKMSESLTLRLPITVSNLFRVK